MKKPGLAALVILLLFLATACEAIPGGPNTLSSSQTTNINGNTLVTAKPVNGLALFLALSSDTIKAGDNITITAGEWNTLSASNNVTTAGNWPAAGLIMGPCGTLNYPMGAAIYSGYLTEADIASAIPLVLYDPNAVYHCPMILSGIDAYFFQPFSDNADVYGSCEPNPCFTGFTVSGNLTFTGYWLNGTPPGFIDFTPGMYTVSCGDEWGSLAVTHFVVLGE